MAPRKASIMIWIVVRRILFSGSFNLRIIFFVTNRYPAAMKTPLTQPPGKDCSGKWFEIITLFYWPVVLIKAFRRAACIRNRYRQLQRTLPNQSNIQQKSSGIITLLQSDNKSNGDLLKHLWTFQQPRSFKNLWFTLPDQDFLSGKELHKCNKSCSEFQSGECFNLLTLFGFLDFLSGVL